jgi:hypothetical protein
MLWTVIVLKAPRTVLIDREVSYALVDIQILSILFWRHLVSKDKHKQISFGWMDADPKNITEILACFNLF